MHLASKSDETLQITTDLVGAGVGRACYVHPEDPDKAVKIPIIKDDLQSKREVKYYKKLIKRKGISFDHCPRYYGTVKTNLGDGFVVDLIRDYDEEVSKPLSWYLENGLHFSELPPYLEELKNYFLSNLIIFNYDMGIHNLLFQKCTPGKVRLVMIDGLGDTVAITWLNLLASHVRSKIERRFSRFLNELYASQQVRAQQEPLKHPVEQ